MSAEITDEQIETFREQGYLVVENAFDESEVEQMRAAADHLLELLVNSSLANDRTSGRLTLVEDESGDQLVKKVQPVNDLSMTFSDLATDDRIVDLARGYMEDEPRLMEEKLNYKQPLPRPVADLETRVPSEAWPVHSDWAYFRADDYPQNVVSSAVALDDVTAENGAMRFWPGTNDEFVEHEPTDNGLEVPPERVDEDAAELVEAPAGSLVVFDSLVWHDSSPNVTDDPRRLLILSHYPAGIGEERGIKPDQRNGPARLNESPYEWRYQELKEAGEFEDSFEAPTY